MRAVITTVSGARLDSSLLIRGESTKQGRSGDILWHFGSVYPKWTLDVHFVSNFF